jgi:leader peptidase (prepilin peptidase) / N-methyltransferase
VTVDSLLAGLVGLALGSFLNVVITRLPHGESVWGGRSRCPQCRTPLPWYDNIPLCSYVWLRGRCRSCGAAIPWRYPLVELAGGLMALGLWYTFPNNLLLLAYAPFGLALITLSAIDLEHRLLPDVITIPVTILGLLLALVLPQLSFLEAATGALAGAGLFYGVGRIYEKWAGRRGLAGGDVKMLAMIGAFLGVWALPPVILISAGLGTLTGLIRILGQGPGARGQWRTISLPYGPFLAAGAGCYLFWGERLLNFLSGGG